MSEYPHLGWTPDMRGTVIGYRVGHGQRIGMSHILVFTDAGPGAVERQALCRGLMGASVSLLREDGDTDHMQAKQRYGRAQSLADARKGRIGCVRCLDRADRMLAKAGEQR